jgi:hypothetical protein
MEEKMENVVKKEEVKNGVVTAGEVTADEEKIKKEAEEIYRSIQEQGLLERLHDASAEAVYYNEDAYILKDFADFVGVSEYVAKLQTYITELKLIAGYTFKIDELQNLLHSKNKQEFLENFKDYVCEIEEAAELEKDSYYEIECDENVYGKELLTDEKYKYAVVLVQDAPCWAAAYVAAIVMCRTRKQAEKIAESRDIIVDLDEESIEEYIDKYIEQKARLAKNYHYIDPLEIVDADDYYPFSAVNEEDFDDCDD